jgi:hypothetical protein
MAKCITDLKILPFHSQYVPSRLLFVVDNKSMHNLNSEMHNINTRQNLNFTNIHQSYLYIKKEFTPSASKCSITSLKVSKKKKKQQLQQQRQGGGSACRGAPSLIGR